MKPKKYTTLGTTLFLTSFSEYNLLGGVILVMILSVIILICLMQANVLSSVDINFSSTIYNIFNETTCSTTWGEDGATQCLGVHIKFHGFVKSTFLAVLDQFDNNNLVRRLNVDIREHYHTPVNAMVGSSVDDFLSPRPWWMVAVEGLSDQRHNRSMDSVIRNHHIKLLRYSQQMEPHLRLMAGVQFPPPSVCKETKLMVGRMLNAGWGAQMANFGVFHAYSLYSIFTIWDSRSNLPSEVNSYTNSFLCPNVVNKRLCVFLPMTNCSLPKNLTGVPAMDWPSDTIMFTNASEDGTLMNGYQHIGEPQNDYHQYLFSRFGHMLNQPFKTSRFIDAAGNELTTTGQGPRNSPYVRNIFSSHGLMYRHNAHYRQLIRERIAAFRAQYNVSTRATCTAVHIRRGDRIDPGVDMKEYCANFTRNADGSECKDREGVRVECIVLDDKGCFSLQPFGAIRLQAYLDMAWELQKTRTIFVMTDDPEWLELEKKSISSEWVVASLGAGPNSRHHASENATAHGVDFWASVALAKACTAFVGHWVSEVAELVFYAMCMHHGENNVGVCPPACDMGNNLMTEYGQDRVRSYR